MAEIVDADVARAKRVAVPPKCNMASTAKASPTAANCTDKVLALAELPNLCNCCMVPTLGRLAAKVAPCDAEHWPALAILAGVKY